MRRRDLLAGVLGAGVVAGGGAVALGGVPSLGEEEDVPEPTDPVTVQGIDARGSEAGPLTVPLDDRLTVLSFFATTCRVCERKMPNLVDATGEFSADEVEFVSVTAQPVGDGVPEDEVVEWFESRGGDWTLAHDPVSELSVAYNGIPYPKAAAVDPEGRVWWEDTGYAETEKLVTKIDDAMAGASAYGSL